MNKLGNMDASVTAPKLRTDSMGLQPPNWNLTAPYPVSLAEWHWKWLELQTRSYILLPLKYTWLGGKKKKKRRKGGCILWLCITKCCRNLLTCIDLWKFQCCLVLHTPWAAIQYLFLLHVWNTKQSKHYQNNITLKQWSLASN